MVKQDWRAEWERLVRVAERHPGYDVWPVRCGAILAADAALRAAEAARDDYRAKWESVSATLCEVARVGRQQNEMAECILIRVKQLKADLALEAKDG